jgi:Amidohydrolase
MKTPSRTLFWILTLLLCLGLALFYAGSKHSASGRILNFHESVGSMEDVPVLQEVSQKLGIEKTLLAALPTSFLRSTGGLLSLDGVEKSNELAMQITAQTSEQESFDYLCALNMAQTDWSEQTFRCLEQGAKGVKLYNGYSYSHSIPVNDVRLEPVYKLLEESDAFVMLPLNSGLYAEELLDVLNAYPTLPVVCSHYCLSSQNLQRLTGWMNEHPNLYVDTSFGSTQYAVNGFKVLSDNAPEFRVFFENFQDRILFGTDNVVNKKKEEAILAYEALVKTYLLILTEDRFASPLVGVLEVEDVEENYQGLALSPSIQEKVFWKNGMDLLE